MKIYYSFCLTFVLIINSVSIFSQLKVKSDGTVKIGSAIAYPDGGDLQVVNINKTTDARVFAASPNIARFWALNSVYCYAFGVDEVGRGQIYGNINTNDKLMTFNSSGCFGINNYSPGTSYKLYVGGYIYCTGIAQSSDLSLKRDINPINNSIELLKSINGKTYYLKNDDTLSNSLKNKLHYGFIAQDVQKEIPDLVFEVDDSSKTLAINYDGFIPLLVEAVKKQQQTIENLEQEISQLKMTANLNMLTLNESDNKLYQNNPNPFNENTEICCFVNKNAVSASVNIYNLQGTQIKSYKVNDRGLLTITINGSEFEPGMFLYSLFVDGKIIDTKQMALTK